MNEKYAILIVVLLCSVTITGCIGDDGEERIEQLETEAIEYQGMMASLNQTLDMLEGDMALLNASIETLNSRIADLDGEILQHISDIAQLNEQNESNTD